MPYFRCLCVSLFVGLGLLLGAFLSAQVADLFDFAWYLGVSAHADHRSSGEFAFCCRRLPGLAAASELVVHRFVHSGVKMISYLHWQSVCSKSETELLTRRPVGFPRSESLKTYASFAEYRLSELWN